MTRDEWLASLQTFDKVWVPPDKTGPGRVMRVIRLGDGRLVEEGAHVAHAHDLRKPWKDGTQIEPVPDAPWGRCPRCSRPMANAYEGKKTSGECLRCWWDDHPPACPGGCKNQEEHDAEVRAQRRRCGLAPSVADPVH